MLKYFRRIKDALFVLKKGKAAALSQGTPEARLKQAEMSVQKQAIIKSTVRLNNLQAKDIMVDRSDIAWLDLSNPKSIAKTINNHPHTRYPVCHNTLDNMLGVVHIKDILPLLKGNPANALKKKIQKPMFVAPSIRSLDLVVEFKNNRQHLAFVVDEFGGVDGVVTIQDIVEEIVGQLDHQLEDDNNIFFDYQPDTKIVLADGRYLLDDLESQFGHFLTPREREADLDTLAGLITLLTGKLPSRGQVVKHSSGLEFEIMDADARRISKVRVHHIGRLHKERPTDIGYMAKG